MIINPTNGDLIVVDSPAALGEQAEIWAPESPGGSASLGNYEHVKTFNGPRGGHFYRSREKRKSRVRSTR